MVAKNKWETEALQVEVGHFVDCINGLEKPLTGGESGLWNSSNSGGC